MMWILIPALLIVAIIAAFAGGVLRFQKKQREPRQTEELLFKMPGQEPQEEPQAEPEELVDLVDYYADYPEEEREKKKTEPSRREETDEQYDRLCNLKVGRGFLQDAQNLLSSLADSGQKFVLIYFDFNRFRFINTLRGFSTGDYALTRIAQEVGEFLPEGALFTRISADHFAILMAYIDDNQLQELHEHIRRSADHIRGDIGAKSGLQISMGVSRTNSPADYDIFRLMRRANIARHCIKSAKTETYSQFDDSMLSSFLYGESALEDYTEHQYADDFLLFLRPQLQLAFNRVTACDSMARWSYEDANDASVGPGADGSILPGSNLKAAYRAVRAISRWRKAGNIPIPITVTLGEIDFFKRDLDDFFGRCLSEFQVEPKMLTVAVSLHIFRMEPELAGLQAKKLSELGVRLAVCDIDRGVRSLEVLEGVKANYLKLHKSCVRDLEKNEERRQEVEQIVSMARSIGAETVFEGADNSAILNLLAELKGDFAQGYYVGKPNDIGGFTEQMADFLKGGPREATVILDDETLQKGDFNVY